MLFTCEFYDRLSYIFTRSNCMIQCEPAVIVPRPRGAGVPGRVAVVAGECWRSMERRRRARGYSGGSNSSWLITTAAAARRCCLPCWSSRAWAALSGASTTARACAILRTHERGSDAPLKSESNAMQQVQQKKVSELTCGMKQAFALSIRWIGNTSLRLAEAEAVTGRWWSEHGGRQYCFSAKLLAILVLHEGSLFAFATLSLLNFLKAVRRLDMIALQACRGSTDCT